MAGVKFIDEARSALEQAVVDLATIARVCVELTPTDAQPAWVSMLETHVERIDERMLVYTRAVHEHALPVLRDMAVIARR